MTFITDHATEIISTVIIVITIVTLRLFVTSMIKKFASGTNIKDHRTDLVIKYINLFLSIVLFLGLGIIWGVKASDVLIVVSSITTIIGVTLFAQWSILSNITAGIILFFYYPFRIGDTIKIHDKDYPIEGEIEDIKLFHVTIITPEGEVVIYPNNLFFHKGISVIKIETEDESVFE